MAPAGARPPPGTHPDDVSHTQRGLLALRVPEAVVCVVTLEQALSDLAKATDAADRLARENLDLRAEVHHLKADRDDALSRLEAVFTEASGDCMACERVSALANPLEWTAPTGRHEVPEPTVTLILCDVCSREVGASINAGTMDLSKIYDPNLTHAEFKEAFREALSDD